MENLKALVYGQSLNDYQRALAQMEFVSLRSQLTASRKQNAELVEFLQGIVDATPGSWNKDREDFNEEFVVWAKSVARNRIAKTALRSAEQQTGGDKL